MYYFHLVLTFTPHYIILVNPGVCSDCFSTIVGLEALGELAWCLGNETPLSTTPTEIYEKMFQMLLVADFELVIASLEALYNLSFYGGDISESMVAVSRSVEVLMYLLTVQAESFGDDALARIKLITPASTANVRPSNVVQNGRQNASNALSAARNLNGANVSIQVGSRGNSPRTPNSLLQRTAAFPTASIPKIVPSTDMRTMSPLTSGSKKIVPNGRSPALVLPLSPVVQGSLSSSGGQDPALPRAGVPVQEFARKW